MWASAFLPRALTYLAHAGVRDLGTASCSQLVEQAEAAACSSPAPPRARGRARRSDERLVNATLGLGAPVVEGAAPMDTVRLPRGGAPLSVLADKRRALVVGPTGLEEIAVPEHRARAAALSPDALAVITGLADRLEERSLTVFGKVAPLDVEFAVESGGGAAPVVWLLQVRPITGGGFPEGGTADTVWSRTNVGEALPGPATPLTWSIARAFSDKGFQEAFAALGCRVPRGASLVGNVQGRFYLNLSVFMQIAAQVPGLSPRALLTASGGASPEVIETLERQIEGVSRSGFLRVCPSPRRASSRGRPASSARSPRSRARDRPRPARSLDMDLGLLPDDGPRHDAPRRCGPARPDRHPDARLRVGVAREPPRALPDARAGGPPPRLGPRRRSRRGPHRGRGRVGLGRGRAYRAGARGRRRKLDSANPGPVLARVAEVVRADPEASLAMLAGRVHAPADLPAGPFAPRD